MNKESILEMNSEEARNFFMEPTSYFDVILPKYFNLAAVLSKAKNILRNRSLSSLAHHSPANLKINDLNYALFINKNGKYDWEPLYLIHPLIYVNLVNYITRKDVWKKFIDRFNYFDKNTMTKSYSIPFQDKGNKDTYIKTDNKEMINDIINNYTKYNYCITTHVIDCYGSVYTHTISWALETKQYAKDHKDKKSDIGNKIDKMIRHLQYNQTNGIPQGNIISDIILELILSYADFQLYRYVRKNTDTRFKLLRYKNRYIIFTKNQDDADTVMKWLLIALEDLNMSFNGKDTHIYKSKDMVLDLFKPDKLYKMGLKSISDNLTLHDELLQIETLSNKYPNSQSIKHELFNCYIELFKETKSNSGKNNVKNLASKLFKEISKSKSKDKEDYKSSIDIITSIIVKNPSSFLVGISLISLILDIIYNDRKSLHNINNDFFENEIDEIKNKFGGMVHTEYANIWLQRLELCIKDISNIEDADNPRYKLFNKVLNPEKMNLWMSKWMHNGFDESQMIDIDARKNVTLKVPLKIVKEANNLYD